MERTEEQGAAGMGTANRTTNRTARKTAKKMIKPLTKYGAKIVLYVAAIWILTALSYVKPPEIKAQFSKIQSAK